ncbi:DUF4127 family protein [Paenibacillaceae bacterium]|nr:DUF4127 family protein [Paenibacillaceae bacterium]
MKNVLYVPLDDRPVNLDDVILLGKSAGLNLITPNEQDIRNRIDSEKTVSEDQITSTSSPTYGNTANIRQFIWNNAGIVEGFIISIDMLAYGGLIGGRRLRTNGGGTYPHYDSSTTHLLEVIRQIKQMYPNKPVYVLDTIMRLATTAFADGLLFTAYSESRNFMGQPRQPFTASTTFNDILYGYDLSSDGTPYGNTSTFNKDHYYFARQHKFKSNCYVLDQLARCGYIDFLAIGVDDANTEGVQINEIRFAERYITTFLGGIDGQNPNRAIILPDADGLGHSLVARMANQLYRCGAKTRYRVRYYGPHGSTIINPYEYMDVHENMMRHIDVIGGQCVAHAPDVEILAITAADEASDAVSEVTTNAANCLATAVIDFTGGGVGNAEVTEALLGNPYTGRVLGYSAWNTAGNKIGIALGMAQARYAYLVSETQPWALSTAVNAHGSLLFKRFLKDYYYKALAIVEIRQYAREHCIYTNVASMADQNMLLFNSASDYIHLQQMLRNQMQAHMATLSAKNAFLIGCAATSYDVRQISGNTWTLAGYISACLDYKNPDFIWGRAFEITLSPSISLC